jgi:RHS repeat-associated protein
MGSVMTATNEYGALEERYEYDAFGKPYVGDLTQGMNLGYTGKPYDTVTGLYNYGYRDYKPEAARFTTVDPVRDGTNWFAYVNNDPVNWVDWWGLSASDKQSVRVTTAGMEFNLVTVPSILTGNLNTITKGFLDASFYINDSPKPAFTAHYTYSVNQKTGFEITVLGLSTTAGTATKTFDSPKTNEEIARDFQSAGTVSQYVGVSVVVGGTISSSTSGGWVFTQSSFGADGGLKINAAGGTQYTETRLDVNSIQDWK